MIHSTVICTMENDCIVNVLYQTMTKNKMKIKKETILFIILMIITVIAGWLYLCTGFDATWGGDDNIVHLSLYNATRDRSYLQCFFDYIGQAFQKYIHPTESYRYLPLAYWNDAVWKFAAYDLTNYRIAILCYTYLAIFLTAVFLGGLTNSKKNGLLCLAVTPLVVNLYSTVEVNSLYTYQAMAQRSYLFWIIAMLLLFCHTKRKHIGFLIAAAVFTFFSCGVIEIGYVFIFPCFLIVFLLYTEWKQRIIAFGSQCISVILSFCGYVICASHQGMGTDTSTRFQLSPIVETFSKQISASFSLPPVLLSEQEFHLSDIRVQDVLLPLVLTGVMAVTLIQMIRMKQEIHERTRGVIYCIALLLLILPAGLISIAEKFQVSNLITWSYGWIMSIVGTIGVGLFLAVLLTAVSTWIGRNTAPSWLQYLLILLLTLFVGSTGIYSRAATNISADKHTRPRNDLLIEAVQSDVFYSVPEESLLYCDYPIWGDNANALEMFIDIYANRHFQTVYYEGQEMEKGSFFAHYGYGEPVTYYYVGKTGEDAGTLENVRVWIKDRHSIVQKKQLTYAYDGELYTVDIQPEESKDAEYMTTIPQMNFAELFVE